MSIRRLHYIQELLNGRQSFLEMRWLAAAGRRAKSVTMTTWNLGPNSA